MEAIIKHAGNVRFEAVARGHKVLCDQPLENGGEDAGMSPPEFLLVSLGTCAGYYALQYLVTRGLPSEGLEVRVAAGKAPQPARLGSFRIEVKTPPLEGRHREGVLRAVKSCLVHNTLLHEPEVDIVLQEAELATA